MRKVNRARHAVKTVSAEGCQIETNGNEIVLSTPTPPKATVSCIGEGNLDWLDRATRSAGQYEVLA